MARYGIIDGAHSYPEHIAWGHFLARKRGTPRWDNIWALRLDEPAVVVSPDSKETKANRGDWLVFGGAFTDSWAETDEQFFAHYMPYYKRDRALWNEEDSNGS